MNRRSFLKTVAAAIGAAVLAALGLGRKATEMAVMLGRGSPMLLDREGIKASNVKRRMGELLAPIMKDVADDLATFIHNADELIVL